MPADSTIIRACRNCGAALDPRDTRVCPSCGAILRDTTDEEDAHDPWEKVLTRLRSTLAGRYEIMREIGRGGMGVLFLARDVRLDRLVAIKVLSPALMMGWDAIERFRREAVTVANLSHPNIVVLHEVREEDELLFFVMQYVAGPSLEQALRSGERLSLPAIGALLYQIGSAIAYAHRKGVIHRDIKPANILLTAEGHAVVTDFGIARVDSNPSQTQTGVALGTPTYMSPELVSGLRVTSASDQYALGILAYELLTGAPPFQRDTSFALMHAHMEEAPPPIRTLRPDCPPDIDAAVMRMLSKSPGERFPDVDAALVALGVAPLSSVESDPTRRELSTLAQSQRVVAVSLPPMKVPAKPPAAPPATTGSNATEPQTQVSRLSEWVEQVRGDSEPRSAADAGGHTEVFGAGESGSSLKNFSVALSINAAPNQAQVGTRIRCTRFPFTIGRATTADLCIPGDDALSRTHLQILKDDHGFSVRDESVNGVYVNGRQLKGSAEPLRIGASITLSRSTSLTFVADLPALPDLSGQLIADRYRLEERKHESVKCSTYLANDVRFPRSLALKVFSPTLMSLPQYRDEFSRQAELAVRLKHPHICKIIDFGEATVKLDGRSQRINYLCTEYMEGGNLASLLESSSAPGLSLVMGWVGQLAAALNHAHRNGVVHGDVKPSCIVFDRDGTPYLTDFALASAGRSDVRTVVGSPDYLAPEQWAAEGASEATDQYSLAVLAYLMVTGTRPHEGQADPVVRERNFRRGPPPAHDEAKLRGRDGGGITPQLSAVLAKAMSVRASDRYSSVLDFSLAFAQSVTSPNRRSGQPRIFVSYQRSASAGWANLLAGALVDRHGCSVFIDTQARDGAPQIPVRLKEEISKCDIFVCLLAEGTLNSDWVRQEIKIAFQNKKPMVPVFHEDFHPTEADAKRNPSVRALLNFAAVHLFDRRNIHVDHTVTDLADRIRRLMSSPA